MFAGIVEKKSRILAVSTRNQIQRVQIAKPSGWKLQEGQSVNVDGICSTVVKHTATFFEVEYMPETLSKTAAGQFKKGVSVNLERSLKFGDRIDGHPVYGHIDAALPVREIKKRGKSVEITLKPKAVVAREVRLQGSVALNGVSLTLARKHGPNFTVAIIPHTLAHTNLGALQVGDLVNVELDRTSEYVESVRRK